MLHIPISLPRSYLHWKVAPTLVTLKNEHALMSKRLGFFEENVILMVYIHLLIATLTESMVMVVVRRDEKNNGGSCFQASFGRRMIDVDYGQIWSSVTVLGKISCLDGYRERTICCLDLNVCTPS